jgi:hypothetical protein
MKPTWLHKFEVKENRWVYIPDAETHHLGQKYTPISNTNGSHRFICFISEKVGMLLWLTIILKRNILPD